MSSVAMFLFLVFCILPAQVVSSGSMIVTYGQPSNYSSYQTVSTDSWENCVMYCYELESCVLAYSPVDPINCQIFSTKQIWVVQKLDSSQDQLVAFKVDNTDQTCPSGDNAPTFNNGTATGTTMSSSGIFTHNITFTGDQWELSYQNYLVCPSGWTTFTRPLTNWCIQLFGGPNVTYNQDEAATICADSKAVLSGLETQDERTFVADTAWSLMGDNYPNWAAFWISGVRRPECTAADWPSVSGCDNSIEQFTYSDLYLTNYAGYTWDVDTPDRNASGTWQNCIQIWIRNVETSDDHPNGAADDQKCEGTVFESFALRGGVCGKLPDVPRT